MNNTLIDSLLGHARDMLDGALLVPLGQSSRLSSFLTRQALEEVVHELCQAQGDRLDHPVTMRSRLIFIRARYDSETAALAEGAWSGLCEACHHHSYELTPTAEESRHLLGLVSELHAVTG
ncbi:hypothetical protein [Amycolatopsis keratiniphila]|uniref:hypothetical protein n=1 Tax=Amycolatopsis keratiniphila TaxID=129921 RepID=UPI00087D5583|nr:hypothetical protein [Amycolatopsis keratiniphila]OLZ51896.1 hypothetical protein BS330_24965 [Amycolatopsis keratiniphila subsp. nogabecina]SDU62180.1 hypothetical protein SAMN04489733_7170 [Amycolatopsis keratiniphila]